MRSRSLERRIGRLEELRRLPEAPVPLVLVVPDVEPKRELQAGERIVIDWFRNTGTVVWASKRIASGPDDQGVRCAAGTILEDQLAEMHERCRWRNSMGFCRMCQGTPIAGRGFEAPAPIGEKEKQADD